MKSFSLALCTFLAVGSQALPQYRPQQSDPQQLPQTNPPSRGSGQLPNLPGGCRYEYKIVQAIEYVETEKEVCIPYTDRVCETKQRQVCNPYDDEVCRVVYKSQCETKYNEVCTTRQRDVLEEYEVDDCNKIYQEVCESTWVVEANGDKVWKEDPDTCQKLPVDDCKPVKKTRTKTEDYQDCQDVPYQDCKDVPEEECNTVTKEKCESQAYQDCHDEIKQDCQIVHKKTPTTVSSSKRVRVCDNNHQQNVRGQDDVVDAVVKAEHPPQEDEGDLNADDLRSAFVFST